MLQPALCRPHEHCLTTAGEKSEHTDTSVKPETGNASLSAKHLLRPFKESLRTTSFCYALNVMVYRNATGQRGAKHCTAASFPAAAAWSNGCRPRRDMRHRILRNRAGPASRGHGAQQRPPRVRAARPPAHVTPAPPPPRGRAASLSGYLNRASAIFPAPSHGTERRG